VAGESSEAGWISLLGKLNIIDQAEIMEQTNGGSLKVAEAESGGIASDGAGDPKAIEKGTECTETLDDLHIGALVDMGQLVGKALQAGKASHDPAIVGDSAGDPAKNEKELECTETLDHILTCGLDIYSGMGKQFLGAFTSQAYCRSCGLVLSCDPYYAECVEPTTGLERKSCDEDVPRESAMVSALKFQEESVFVGDENSRFVIVPFGQTAVEQLDFYITGEVMDGMKRGIGACTAYKGGSSSGSLVNVEGEQFIDVPLEVEPLEVHPECPKGKVCEWVIERVKGMCHVWGMSCEGYEGELEKLFRKIEGNRGKAYSLAATPSRSTLKGNRELRGLQWTMNYDGKMGKEKRGKKQKQRARGGGLSRD
jgi:hypothetical protein